MDICKECGSGNVNIKSYNGKVGLYCKECGKFIKDISREELASLFLAVREQNSVKAV